MHILRNSIIFLVFFSTLPNYSIAESINDYSIMIGDQERIYQSEIVGWSILDKKIINLPLKQDKANYLCLKKRHSQDYFSPEIIILWPKTKDTDEDGLSDITENKLGTNPYKKDTDEDGFSDAEEWLIWGVDATADYDGDGQANILDKDALASGYSDSNNPDIEEITLVVINKKNSFLPALSLFQTIVIEKKIKTVAQNQITFKWKSNKEPIIGYRIYYKCRYQNKETYTGLLEGDSPIEVGNTTRFNISAPTKIGVFTFSVTAYNKELESGQSLKIKVKAIEKNGKKIWLIK